MAKLVISNDSNIANSSLLILDRCLSQRSAAERKINKTFNR